MNAAGDIARWPDPRTGESRAVVSGTLEQDPAKFRKLVVPFVLDMGKGGEEVRVVVMDKASTAFRFEVPSVPGKVEVDPNRNNLAHYKRR